MRIGNYCITITAILFFCSCSKDKIIVPHQIISLPAQCKIERIVFTNDSTLFACGGNKLQNGYIFKSTNKGQNWQIVYQGEKKLNSIFFLNENIGYACGDSMAFVRTSSSGENWIDTMKYNYFWNQERANLRDLYFWSAARGILGSGKNFAQGNFYASYNAGNTLDCIHGDNAINRIIFPSKNRGFIFAIGAIYRVFDSTQALSPYGFTLNYEIADIKGDIYTSASFLNEKIGWVCGYNGGIYKTEDGGYTWQTCAKTNYKFNDIAFLNNQIGYAVGEDGVIVKTENGGKNWQLLDCAQTNNSNIQCIVIHQDLIVLGDQNGSIYIFKNNESQD